MSESKHWLDESSDADDFERSILRSGTISDPTDAKRNEVWANVLGALAIAPAAAPAATTTAAKAAASSVSKTAAVSLGVGKGFLVGLAIYGATSGISEIAKRLSVPPAPSVIAPSVASKPTQQTVPGSAPQTTLPAAPTITNEPALTTVSPSAATVASAPASELANASAHGSVPARVDDLPSVAAFESAAAAPASSAARASQLKAEAAALSRAREALRAGHLTDAFAQLEASRKQFSAPELYQEREALMIELLSRSGQAAVAEQRASAFLERFPESPHADQIRRFVNP